MNPRAHMAGLHCHIDGVFGDAYAVGDEEREFLRAIYFPIVDDVHQYVLARGIKIGRPSRLALGMALRDCVARHRFLALVLTSDRGSELFNDMAREASAKLNFQLHWRPSGAPRHGGKGESLNAPFNAFLQELAGGTYYDAAGRAADGSKKGRKHAAHSLAGIIQKGDDWLFEVWNKSCPPGSNQTREELFFESIDIFGDAVVKCEDSPFLRFYTGFPLAGKNFDYKRGFRFGGRAFMSDELAAAIRFRKRFDQARLDTMDPSLIWIRQKDNRIIPGYSQEHHRVAAMDIAQRVGVYRDMLSHHRQAKINNRERREREADAADRDPQFDGTTLPSLQPENGAASRPAPVAEAQTVKTWTTKRARLARLGDEQ